MAHWPSYRAALRAIRDQIITRLKTDQIDESQAIHAGIQQRNLCLDGPEAPLFFQPYQEELEPLDELEYAIYDPSLEDYQNIRDLHITMQNCLWGDFNFEAMFENDYYWHVSFTARTRMDINLPHMKCLIANDITGDDRLTRGELISIVNIMVGRLHTRHLRPHVIAPVMLYSLMGPHHLRVLEAYYNGVNLVVRKTKLYDMKEYDEKTLELLTRWWLGHAVGDTTKLITPETLVS
ncbi:hypothetical protein BO94DRAFT_565698 [Aspergillus sclerotioniger CBS 115572]|uniref:Uncharacterized protein n=1 Tax=Aspergillus sclerotioniger CBS 115572 TaxID=1450535 RepID=A0A317WMV6_9EURO|nr:hypothetical protein BO94DRAFT_565698 [Aspergillus sclerotioniger CBS 115572]PWY87804.1 hypothetical protein BO94DRAFT_565698 [Aspergillus sclerotioniger CBS 115572]